MGPCMPALWSNARTAIFYGCYAVWNGMRITRCGEKNYRGHGIWKGTKESGFGKQFPWMGSMCSIRLQCSDDRRKKYKETAVATAQRIMDPANGWWSARFLSAADGLEMALSFIHIRCVSNCSGPAPDIPYKIEKMLEHVWTNHHGKQLITLHRPIDDASGTDGIRTRQDVTKWMNWTVHAQSEAVRAFGVFAIIAWNERNSAKIRTQFYWQSLTLDFKLKKRHF